MTLIPARPARANLEPLLLHQRVLLLHRPPPRRQRRHPLVPRLRAREPRELLVRAALHDAVDPVVPRHEAQVRVRHLVADQPVAVREPAVENAEDALQLRVVPFYGRGELFLVQNVEPARGGG